MSCCPTGVLVEVEEEEEEEEKALSSDSEAENAAAAAVPVKNKGGRPRLDHSAYLAEPAAPHCPTTLHQLLTDVLTLADDHNLTQRATAQLMALLQQHMPVGHHIPHRRQAANALLLHSPVKVKHYVVCPGDCQLARLHDAATRDAAPMAMRLALSRDRSDAPLLDVNTASESDKAQLRSGLYSTCTLCGARFADNKGVFHKVHTGRHIGGEEFCTSWSCCAPAIHFLSCASFCALIRNFCGSA